MAAIAFLFILTIPLWGYFILSNNKLHPVRVAWALTITFIGSIFFFVHTEPLILMTLYISSTFLTLKMLVTYNHLSKEKQLSYRQWLLFSYGWFGMNPRPFLSFPSKPLPDYRFFLLKGFSRIILGLLLINCTGYFENRIPGRLEPVLYLFYLVGLSLILHFGILNISNGILRSFGIHVTSLFKDPIRSRSLNEFWSKRWNLAFVELTTIAVLRPVKSIYGGKTAFWASFIFSGLLHELAISLPVESGFGKPFLYFIIQALLILSIDHALIRKISNPVISTLTILTCLFLPIFLLFHVEFIRHVILPLVNYLKIIN